MSFREGYSSYTNYDNWPWSDAGKEFDDWFKEAYSFGFGEKWLEPHYRRIAAKAWDAAILKDVDFTWKDPREMTDEELRGEWVKDGRKL